MKHAREDYNRIQDPDRKIPDDEPVFLLRASDMCAPAAIRHWAYNSMANNASKALVDAALAHADAMEEWQRTHGRKVADAPGL